MSIAGIAATVAPVFDPSAFQNVRGRVQQDFSQIAQSLQSNSLAGAQQAYSDLAQLTPGGTPASTSSANPFQSDLASLGSALNAGDLGGAQSAFQKLETDATTAQTTGGAPNGHFFHRQYHAPETAASTTTPSTASTDSSSSPITAGSVLGALVKTGISLFA